MQRWTERDMPELQGKVTLVTGANSGLGLATSRALAAKGAHVILACRSTEKAEQAIASIRQQLPQAAMTALPLDLSELEAVEKAAQQVQERFDRLDILCNNAGVMGLPLTRTRTGFEMLFATNHLGHFALTGHLFPLLQRTPGARVVSVASLAHRQGRLPLDDLNWERQPYSRAGAYGRSKLANLVFSRELDRRLRAKKLDAISVAAHPGYSATNIVYGGGHAKASLLRSAWNGLAGLGNVLIAQPPHLGALPTLYAATAPEVAGGDYYGPHGPIEFRGYPKKVRCAPLAEDADLARGLWEASERFTGMQWLS